LWVAKNDVGKERGRIGMKVGCSNGEREVPVNNGDTSKKSNELTVPRGKEKKDQHR